MIQNFIRNCTQIPYFIGQLSFVTSCRYYVSHVGCRKSGLRYTIKTCKEVATDSCQINYESTSYVVALWQSKPRSGESFSFQNLNINIYCDVRPIVILRTNIILYIFISTFY